jgi:hypothetical protein
VNLCECSHQPDAHYGGIGACEQFDGDFPCSCPRYTYQGDD